MSLGNLNNVREAIAIARECRTILGAAGITLEHPVMRHANNLESVLTYEGTSNVPQLVIGQALTGLAALGSFQLGVWPCHFARNSRSRPCPTTPPASPVLRSAAAIPA